jgi:hypothetical protein
VGFKTPGASSFTGWAPTRETGELGIARDPSGREHLHSRAIRSFLFL